MSLVRVAVFHLRRIFDRTNVDREVDLELRDHVERETKANVARGMTESAARRAALIAFGGVQQYKEDVRNTRALRRVEQLGQDIRFAVRTLRRAPGFAAVAILTIALGVGATSAVFTVVNDVLLRPLPFEQADRLYLLSYLPPGFFGGTALGVADRLCLAFEREQHSFASTSCYQRAQFTITGAGAAERVDGARVGADFFRLLGVAPALGRAFVRGEDAPGAANVAIVSDRLWHERFGSDPHVVGTTIALDGSVYTIVGVAPPGLRFPVSSDIWTPLIVTLDRGNTLIVALLGRLGPGVGIEHAQAELGDIGQSLGRDPREHGPPSTASVVALKSVVTRGVQRELAIFGGAVVLVLLIAGVNLANLLLIRASARRREIALRASLGASRRRVLGQLLTESALVSGAGGALGILVALGGVRALRAIAPDGAIPRLQEVRIDAPVVGFALAVAVLTGILFGLVPALESVRGDLTRGLALGARVIGRSQTRLRGRFVIAELALAFVLLMAAGLMVGSFARMRRVDTGYDAARVTTMSVDLPPTAYPTAEQLRLFHTSMLARLAGIPGVQSVGAVSWRPMGEMGIMGDFHVQGTTPLPKGYTVDKPTVSPGYFRAMGIRLLDGRDFTSADESGTPGVVIVSESVARSVWPGQSAVGKRISMVDEPGPGDWLTVIGVVRDVVQDQGFARHSTIYMSYLQATPPFFINHMTYVVRTLPGRASVAGAMRRALGNVDPAIPAEALQTMNASMLDLVAGFVFQTTLLGTFSLLALLLAAIGTYGVLAYDVAERTREIGIRMALGARSGRVLRMVIGRTLALAGVGIAIGVLGALGSTRVLSRFLFGVSPTDPAAFGGTALVLVGVALAAAMVPAWRASRVDPVIALKEE
ncbi:MAG TPA: ABC transporter permease [Gemmatimonadaceae bacterium]|nr:ABC transporter permease [Gemmatimonadaceae bacterium]